MDKEIESKLEVVVCKKCPKCGTLIIDAVGGFHL